MSDPGEDVCLLTGATGFIGGRLAERLAAEGRQVRCLVREGSDTARLKRLGVELVHGDLDDARSLAPAVDGCRSVVHCAARVSDWGTVREIRRTNVDGTRALLDASRAASVRRFVHLSTTDVYGYPGGGAVDESYTPTRFRNWYAQSKLEAEAEVRRAEAAGLETVILRPATVYGPGSEDVVGEIARAVRARRMFLIAGGHAIAGLCHVENLIDAILLALACDSAAGHPLNITDGLEVTWRQFADRLAAGIDAPPVRWSLPYWLAYGIGISLESGYRALRTATHLELAPLLSRQAVHVLGKDQDFSNGRAQAVLGWAPRVGFDEGLEATLGWLREDYLLRA